MQKKLEETEIPMIDEHDQSVRKYRRIGTTNKLLLINRKKQLKCLEHMRKHSLENLTHIGHIKTRKKQQITSLRSFR